MKKSILIMSAAISVAFLAALTLTIQIFPVVYAYQSQDCECDHWSIYAENTPNDIFTGTSITAHYNGYLFDYADFIFCCGSGGNFHPYYSTAMSCFRKYMDINWNWFGPMGWPYTGTWQHDVDPFPDGNPFKYKDYRDYKPRYYYDGSTAARQLQGLTQQWFQNPSNPSSWWLCGLTWAHVVT